MTFMKTLASLYIGLAVGAILGGVGGATYAAVAAAREGSPIDPGELLIFAAFGMPVGAAAGGFVGAFLGILRDNNK